MINHLITLCSNEIQSEVDTAFALAGAFMGLVCLMIFIEGLVK